MKVGAAQHFFHRRHAIRQIALVDGIAFLPFVDCLIHVPLVGGKDRQGIVVLHLFHRAETGCLWGIEKLVDSVRQQGQKRPIVDAANTCHIAVPTLGLRDSLERSLHVHQA